VEGGRGFENGTWGQGNGKNKDVKGGIGSQERRNGGEKKVGRG